MNLENLLGINLEAVEPDRATIQRLLAAAERNIADAHIAELSLENRFDAAYKAIMQCSNAALQANGYRTLTSKPGHHQTMIQVLNQTIQLKKETIILLDGLRKQRNLSDYTGDIVSESVATACIQQAENLLQHVTDWLKQNRSDLLG